MTDRLRKAQIRLNAEIRRCDARDGKRPHPGGSRFQRSWIGETIIENAELKILNQRLFQSRIPLVTLAP